MPHSVYERDPGYYVAADGDVPFMAYIRPEMALSAIGFWPVGLSHGSTMWEFGTEVTRG